MMARASILLPLLLITLTSASPAETDPLRGANRRIVRLADMTVEELPGINDAPMEAESLRVPFDKDSIELYVHESDSVYHPVFLLHRAEDFMALYRVTDRSAFRDRAVRIMTKLRSLAHRRGDALFFPYPFAFKVHGSSELLLQKPWYSGMAQGVAVRTSCRLFLVTGDSTWLYAADSAFNSLRQLDGIAGPTVARIDDDGFYWIEEYPLTYAPGMTLNGFVAAVQGVYEYYRLNPENRVKTVLECALTTLQHYLPQYRQPGQRSLYCLGHHRTANEKYHRLHINQMYQLERITQNRFFRRMAKQFEADFGD